MGSGVSLAGEIDLVSKGFQPICLFLPSQDFLGKPLHCPANNWKLKRWETGEIFGTPVEEVGGLRRVWRPDLCLHRASQAVMNHQ
jgi:hypothetical protein